MRATLDSGILIRASTSPDGSAARVIAELAPPAHQILLSEYILDEFSRVMTYPRIQRRGVWTDIDLRANRFRLASVIVEPAQGPPVVLADPKDDPIVYTAVAGKADVLCTLDRHFQSPAVLDFLRTHGIRVLSDVELLRELLLSRPEGHSA